MKNIRFITKGISLFFLIFFFSLQAKGQIGTIMEIELLPNSPNNLEETSVRVYTSWSVHMIGLFSSEVTFDGNLIVLEMCYLATSAAGTALIHDTITIGQLGAGDYELVVFFNENGGLCDFENLVSSDTLQIQVSPGTSTDIVNRDVEVNLHPNPFTGHFNVQVEQHALYQPVSLRLYDYIGREVLNREIESGTIHTISTEHLPPGVYLYRMELDNGQEVSGKVVKL